LLLEFDAEGLGGGHGGGFVDHEWAGFFPKFFVGGAHFFDDAGVFGGDVGFLAGVLEHVEELVINEAVLVVADGKVFPLVLVGFGAGGPAGFLGKKVAVGPR